MSEAMLEPDWVEKGVDFRQESLDWVHGETLRRIAETVAADDVSQCCIAKP
jgi:hypothetical protein